MKTAPLIAASLICLFLGRAAFAGEIVVSAAASLTDAFSDIARGYGGAGQGRSALMNFASSGALLRQLEMGAPVDVFASADEYTMRLAVQKGLVYKDSIVTFARNTLVLIVPAGSNMDIDSTSRLAGADVKRIAIGNPASVPAGRYAKEALERLGMWDRVKDKLIYAEDVRQALDYVRRGEVDAGIVYGTDAARAGNSVRVVAAIDTAEPIEYPVAVAVTARDRKAAEEFIEYLGSGTARNILNEQGFVTAGGAR